MLLNPIINNLLDTDLYKFTMNQFIYHQHKDLQTKYYFNCRTKNILFTTKVFNEIRDQIEYLCTLKFSAEDILYLKSLGYFKDDYLDFLSK